MSRLNAGNVTAASLTTVGMVTLADLWFASGTLYVHDGFGTLVNPANSQTYVGIGNYGSLDAVPEDLTKQTAKAVVLTLSGADPSLIASAMTENYQGRTVTLYVGFLDVNTLAWYANPDELWGGRMDYAQIDYGRNSATIKLNCENRLSREPMVARFTDQDQQIAFPGDKFFDLLPRIPLNSCSWGAVTVLHPGPPPGQPLTGTGGSGNPGGGGGLPRTR